MGRRQAGTGAAVYDIDRGDRPRMGITVHGTQVASPSSRARSQAAVNSSAGMTRAARTNRSEATPRVMRQASIRSSAAASRCVRYSGPQTPSRHRYAGPGARGKSHHGGPRRETAQPSDRNPRHRAYPRQNDPNPNSPDQSSRRYYERIHAHRARSSPPHTMVARRTQRSRATSMHAAWKSSSGSSDSSRHAMW